MDTEAALGFLSRHQPLPSDEDLSEELIRDFDEVRRHFLENPDKRCIPLFLGSFGKGDGFGVYPLVEDVLAVYATDEVVPHLKAKLESSDPSIRYWCGQIAALFPAGELLEALGHLLNDDDPGIRQTAAIALERQPNRKATDLLQRRLLAERDHGVREMISDILAERRE